MHQVTVGRVEPAALDRGHALEPLPLLTHSGSAPTAVPREDDHLRLVSHRRLQAEAWVALAQVGGDGVAAGEGDQLGDERSAPRHDQGLRPEHIEHARPRASGHPVPHGSDPSLEIVGHRPRALAVMGQLAQVRDQLQHVAHRDGIDEVDGDAEAVELVEGLLAVSLPRRHHEIRLEGDERLEIRREHIAHVRLAPGLGRIIAEVRDPHEEVLGADGVEHLGRARDEGHDALGRRGQGEGPPDLVHDLQAPGAHGKERHEGERGDERGHAERSVTPADLKVAISPRIFTAALARPMQRAAPVPSPRRIWRSR